MVNGATIRKTIGVIGNVISFGLFLAPVPTFVRIIKNKSVEEFQPYPYLATVMNCALWVFYGLPVIHKDSILVTTINGVGLAIELVYVFIFFIYSGEKKNVRRNIILLLLLEIIGEAAVVLLTLFAFKGNAKLTFVGVICDVFNVAMYASPILVVGKVIKTKSVEYMPFSLSLVSFCNGLIWAAYALFHPLDLYVLISNGLGCIIVAAQLIIYAIYYFRAPDKEDEKASQIELSDRSRA